MENKKTVKQLQDEFNELVKEAIIKRRERINESATSKAYFNRSAYFGYDAVIYAPLCGYKLKELKDNKPNTLLKEKEKAAAAFVCFANIKLLNNNNTLFQLFSITDDKKPTDAPYFLSAVECSSRWKDARKENGRKFIILNNDFASTYAKMSKHIKRNEQRKNEKKYNRYYYNDVSFFGGLVITH